MNIDVSVEKISLLLSFIQTIAIIPVFVYLILKLLLMLRWINPIKIDIEDHHGSEGILKNLGGTNKIKVLSKRKNFIPSLPHFIINISSIITDKTIRVYPQVYIKVVDIEPINKEFNQIWYKPGMGYGGGPGGAYKYFTVNIPASKNEIIEASFIPNKDDEDLVDFFIIEPDDIEAFALMVDFEAEFIYTIKIGVDFNYRGKRRIIWRGNYKMGKSISQAKQWGFYSYKDETEISEYVPIDPDYEWPLGK